MQDLPLVDISELRAGSAHRSTKAVGGIEAACRDVGFMYVTGHGIDAQTIANMRNAVVAYFSRPRQQKLRDSITRDNYRGYIPTGFFSPNTGGGGADNYEGYKLHLEVDIDDPIRDECDLYGPNRWPPSPADLRPATLAYWQACDAVATALLEAMAVILDVEPAWFLAHFDKPLTNMTLLHYPPQSVNDKGFGIHPHKDTDVLTILAPDYVGGLMLKPHTTGQWLAVQAPPDALVVNTGDLLELWSGGYFVSTPHKVINKTGAERYSFPYFVVPRYDTVVEPLRDPRPGFTRAPVHVGDVSREVWRTNWPDSKPVESRFDLGTLSD